MAVSHIKSITIADGTNTDIARPSDWNSAHYQLLTLSGNTAGFSSVSGTNIIFEGGNNITLSADTAPGAATVRFVGAAGGGAGDGGNTLAAGTQTANSTGTVLFANSNGISFGMSGSSQITASYTVPSQSVQTQGIQGGAAGTQTATSGTLVFANSNGISFGMSGSSQITASYTVPSQSNQSVGIYAASNTTGQSSSSTVDARSITFAGAGVASVGMSAGSVVISVPAGGGGGDGINALVVNAGASTLSTTLTLSNGNNVSFGQNLGVITASASYSQSTGPGAFAAGTQTGTSGTLVFANSNGISFGLSGSSQLTASYTVPNVPAQTNQTEGFYAVGNTTGQSSSSTFDARTLSLNGAGGVSVGMSAGSVIISGPQTVAQTVQPGIQSIQVSNTTYTTGNVIFSNANGASFGSSAGGAVTLSYTVPTVTNSVLTLSDAATSIGINRLAFTNLNGITMSLSTTTGGSATLVGSYTVPTQTNQTLGIYGSGNTTGQSSSSTVDARSITFVGQGVASVGMSAGSVLISVPSGGGAGDGYNIVSMLTSTSGGGTAGATFSALSASIGLMAGSNITLSQTNNTIVVMGAAADSQGMSNLGNTAGTSGLVANQMVFVGGNNVTLSQSVNAGSATLSIVGSAGYTASYWQNMDLFASTTTVAVNQSTSIFCPVVLPVNVNQDFFRVPILQNLGSSTFASTANTSFSYSQVFTFNAVLYSLGAGASSQSLQSISSRSLGMSVSISAQENSTNNNSVTHGLSWVNSTGGTNTFSTSYALTNSTINVSTTHLTGFNGGKFLDFPMAGTLTNGLYFLGLGVSSTQTTNGVAALSACRMTNAFYLAMQATGGIGIIGAANGASNPLLPGLGSFTTAGGGTTASLPMTNISSSASNPIPLVMFLKSGF